MIYLRYLALLLLLTSLIIFLFGYLPKTVYKKRTSQDFSYFKERTIDKVILVVIDSLRPDMVYQKRHLWPSLNDILNKSWAYQTTAELQPPSMSLAKIKCIITGAVIGFIDVLFNTDTGKISQENLIDNVKKYRNFKINFYGDETWLKLFPDQFAVSQPFSPFFIHDFYDSDLKISGNIPQLLLNFNQWDFVIMHYLGLDHMGHNVGPFGSSINKKLSEIDRIIGSLVDGAIKGLNNERNLVILTSDHGMSDLGGHGGSANQEVHVPLIFFNKRFQEIPGFSLENVAQNDIAPSLALLLGVPIPTDNIGVIPLTLLSLIEGSKNQTKALYSNYFQMIANFDKIPIEIEKRFSHINSSIFLLERYCLEPISKLCLENIRKEQSQLIILMRDVKNILQTKFIQHNFLMLEIAFLLCLMALFITLNVYLIENGVRVTVPGSVFLLAILFILSSALFLENFRICLFSAFKMSLLFMVIVLTGHSLTGVKESIQSLISINYEYQCTVTVVIVTLFLNILGLSFQNIIIEEHQMWFLLSNTLIVLYLIKDLIQSILINKEQIQLKSTYVFTIITLILDRILRTLNRTGERWASVLIFGDWLNRSENTTYLMIVISVCILVTGILRIPHNNMFISIITCLLMVINGVHRYTDIIKFGKLANISVWVYYFILLLYIAVCLLYKFYFKVRGILKLSNIILLVCFLICRHQNVILWTGIAIKTVLFRQIWLHEIYKYNIGVQFIIFNIVGMTTFFQQGNSNSLTTIDVQPGFVGMSSYIPIIVGPLVAFQLFSGNLYWIITWIEWLDDYYNSNKYALVSTISIIEEAPMENCDKSSMECDTASKKHINIFPNILLFLTLISSLFTISIFVFSILHKHRMSAWSIYAPKLLYHSLHNGVTLFIYIFIAKLKFF